MQSIDLSFKARNNATQSVWKSRPRFADGIGCSKESRTRARVMPCLSFNLRSPRCITNARRELSFDAVRLHITYS